MFTSTTLRGRMAAFTGATLAALTMTGGVASATETPQVTTVNGNPTCADVQGTQSLRSLKLEPIRQGSTTFRNGSLSGVIRVNDRTFNFSVTTAVDVVIVKGGPTANIYRYSPETTSGTGLHAPYNQSSRGWYGLSHIDFCYDLEAAPPAPQDPCKTNPSGTDMNGNPCTPAPVDPCKTNPSGTDMNGNPCTPAPVDPCKTDPNGMDANGNPCTPAPADPCKTDPNGTDMNGQPCTTAPADPCETNPNGPDMNGQPCTPAPVDPCEGNPSGTDMNGQPCTPAPNVVERQEISPEPVHTVIVEPSESPRQTLAGKAPQGAVLGAVGTIRASRERVLANASLAAPRRCITRPYTAVLRGRGIRRVTMYVNGRKVRTMAGGRSSYALRVLPSQARGGVIRVAARVEYVAASGRRAQTLRMTALRCSGGAAPVRFAG